MKRREGEKRRRKAAGDVLEDNREDDRGAEQNAGAGITEHVSCHGWEERGQAKQCSTGSERSARNNTAPTPVLPGHGTGTSRDRHVTSRHVTGP